MKKVRVIPKTLLRYGRALPTRISSMLYIADIHSGEQRELQHKKQKFIQNTSDESSDKKMVCCLE